jgi:hypothetical protein
MVVCSWTVHLLETVHCLHGELIYFTERKLRRWKHPRKRWRRRRESLWNPQSPGRRRGSLSWSGKRLPWAIHSYFKHSLFPSVVFPARSSVKSNLHSRFVGTDRGVDQHGRTRGTEYVLIFFPYFARSLVRPWFSYILKTIVQMYLFLDFLQRSPVADGDQPASFPGSVLLRSTLKRWR